MHQLSIPRGPDELDMQWMTSCLQRAGALTDGRISQMRVERIAEGVALLGQLARVHLQYSGAAPDAPETVIVKFSSAFPQNVALCEALRLYSREHHFYTRSAHESPLRTPKLYYSGLEGLAKVVLVLEDVRGAQPGDQISGATRGQVLSAVQHAARHHAKFWNKGRAGAQDWVPPLNDPSISPLMQHITASSVPKLLEQLAECFNPTTAAVAQKLTTTMCQLANRMCSGVTTFVHGDFRVENLLFSEDGDHSKLTVIDWQICYDACPPYDVAYLMTQSVEPRVRRESELDVLRTYHSALLENGITDYSLEDCFQDYRKAATYCLCYPLIAAGTLDLSNERGRSLAAMMLNRSLSAAQDLDSLSLLQSLQD
jgi:hypothetical protein